MNLLLAILTGLLLILLFPRWSWTFLAPVALAPLLISAARESRPWLRFRNGWAAGALFWFGVCTWIQQTLALYGGLDGWLAWLTFLLFCLAKGLHLAVFTALAGWLIRSPFALLLVPALWVGVERTHGPLAFAWLTLGDAGVDMSWLLRLAPWTGVYGLSFVFAMTAAASALAVFRADRMRFAPLGVFLGIPLLPALPAPRPSQAAVVVQPNIPGHMDWTWDVAHATQRELLELSASGTGSPLVVWPEMPAPLYFDTDPVFRGAAQDLARSRGAYFLFGAVARTPAGAPLNSAYLLNPAGDRVDRYDKIFLVPFGEFVPDVFFWIEKITQEAGNYVPGSRVVSFPFQDQRIGVFICYESAFPHLVRQFAKSGSTALFNLSNDGYFGKSKAREQHLSLVRMRAAENARWIVRATNDGITAAVDPAGGISARLPSDQRLAARLPYGFSPALTFYSRWGDIFAWLCLAVGVFFSASSAFRKAI
ncbi:MAG: apolipoprotein N-acyltransferase [Bryobacteraceae bacterium]|nr:apolipoprotein N-acyltransferase [Bryobacteraceae bacterium]